MSSTPAPLPVPASLLWGIKASLLRYVRSMPDGRIEVDGSVIETESGFSFPRTEEPEAPGGVLRFEGSVSLTGHAGMLRIVFARPALTPEGSTWLLTIDDQHEPGERVAFARFEELQDHPDGSRTGTGTRLTEDGADLFFFGPYTPGTVLDDPIVVPAGTAPGSGARSSRDAEADGDPKANGVAARGAEEAGA